MYQVCKLAGCSLNITRRVAGNNTGPSDEQEIRTSFANGIDIRAILKTDTAVRRSQGRLIPLTFIDNSLVAVAIVSSDSPSLSEVFFNFADPFDKTLWLTMVGSMLFTAAIMFGAMAVL